MARSNFSCLSELRLPWAYAAYAPPMSGASDPRCISNNTKPRSGLCRKFSTSQSMAVVGFRLWGLGCRGLGGLGVQVRSLGSQFLRAVVNLSTFCVS